jgi:hypothetical protein
MPASFSSARGSTVRVSVLRDGFQPSKWERRCQRAPPSTSGNEWHCQCLGVPHASAQPNAATASATISSTPDGSVASAAASSVQPSATVSAGQRRSRASITATSTSSRCTRAPGYRLRPLLRSCTRARSGAHMQQGAATRARARPADSTVLASIISQCSPLRGYSTHTHWCRAIVRQRLGRFGGGVPGHAQCTPAQQSANRPSSPEDARAA